MDAQPVVVITGASQGIGAGLVAGYRRLGYAVVANSRNVSPSDDPMVLTVAGDIGQPGVGQRIVDAALERFGGSTEMTFDPSGLVCRATAMLPDSALKLPQGAEGNGNGHGAFVAE